MTLTNVHATVNMELAGIYNWLKTNRLTLNVQAKDGPASFLRVGYFNGNCWSFDRVNHQRILHKLCSVGIRGSLFAILTHFLSNRSQHILLVNVVSAVSQGSVLGPLLFLLYTLELFSILENKLMVMPMTLL